MSRSRACVPAGVSALLVGPPGNDANYITLILVTCAHSEHTPLSFMHMGVMAIVPAGGVPAGIHSSVHV